MTQTISYSSYPSATGRERLVDGIVHVIGLVVALVACIALVRETAMRQEPALYWACALYAGTILFSCSISAAYHLLPLHSWRGWMRRVDHAAIYLVIAGTMTPLLLLVDSTFSMWILGAIWAFALTGIVFKFIGNNLDSRWSLVSYVAMGWFSILAMPDFWSTLPGMAMLAIAAGALFYTIGVFFYRAKSMPYRYSLWHGIGLLGAMSFFTANWISVIG